MLAGVDRPGETSCEIECHPLAMTALVGHSYARNKRERERESRSVANPCLLGKLSIFCTLLNRVDSELKGCIGGQKWGTHGVLFLFHSQFVNGRL